MAKGDLHARELLDAFVDSLLATTDPRADVQLLVVLIMNHAGRNLDILGIFTNVAIISLHTLVFSEQVLESAAKDLDVRPATARERPHDPDDFPSEHADSNLVSEA